MSMLTDIIGASRRRGGAGVGLDPDPPAHGWSVRKLRDAYSGQCMRIRRSSDDTETDIGFSAGWIDTAAIDSFVGANSAFVRTWYDQGTAAAWDVGQSSLARQPRIVNAGTLEVLNGQAAAWFNSAGLVNNTTVAGGGASSHFASGLFTITGGASFGRWLSLPIGDGASEWTTLTQWVALGRQNVQHCHSNMNNKGGQIDAPSSGTRFIGQAWVGPSLFRGRTNGASDTVFSLGGTPNLTYDRLGIGVRPAFLDTIQGHCQEMVLYTTDPGSTIRDFVRDNKNAAFSVYS